MGNLRACLLLATTACGNGNHNPDAAVKIPDAAPDAKVWLDAPAPSYDFSCAGATPPAVATMVSVNGTVQAVDLNGTTPSIVALANAKVDACKVGAPNCTSTNHFGSQATSAADGSYTIGPVTTGGSPVDAYLDADPNMTGYRHIYVYPPAPIRADIPGPVLTFTPTAFAGIQLFLGVNQSAANGMIAIGIVDCKGTGVNGATISTKQGGVEVGDKKDAGTFNPMGGGFWLVFNVPPGDTEVSATYMSHTFAAHVVKSVANTTTETVVVPAT